MIKAVPLVKLHSIFFCVISFCQERQSQCAKSVIVVNFINLEDCIKIQIFEYMLHFKKAYCKHLVHFIFGDRSKICTTITNYSSSKWFPLFFLRLWVPPVCILLLRIKIYSCRVKTREQYLFMLKGPCLECSQKSIYRTFYIFSLLCLLTAFFNVYLAIVHF